MSVDWKKIRDEYLRLSGGHPDIATSQADIYATHNFPSLISALEEQDGKIYIQNAELAQLRKDCEGQSERTEFLEKALEQAKFVAGLSVSGETLQKRARSHSTGTPICTNSTIHEKET